MPVQPPVRRRLAFRWIGLILPLSFVFIFLYPESPLAETSDEPKEVGGSDWSPEDSGIDIDLDSLDTDITLLAGYTIFGEQDMYDTYGGLPHAGCEVSVGIDDDARFVLGIRYGAVSGDPFYDTPEFEGDEDVRLRAVPVTAGFRINGSKNPRFRLYWGACFEVAWMEERIPALDPDTGDLTRTDRGWGKGLRLSLTPEWRSRDLRRAFGLTFEVGGSSGEVGKGYHDHEVNMIGIGARLHYTLAL